MKLCFIKETTNETSSDKDIKIILSGAVNNVEYVLTVRGTDDEISKIKNELRLESFGEMVDFELANRQTKIKDY